ncbi:hypothetical protein Tco_0333988 [Tanacetum coccineum]
MKVLVQWKGQTTQDATWEFLDFSELTSCGQEPSSSEGYQKIDFLIPLSILLCNPIRGECIDMCSTSYTPCPTLSEGNVYEVLTWT